MDDTGMPEVFVLMTVPGLTCRAERDHIARLISRSSETASITQSTLARRLRSSSKLPGVISSSAFGSLTGAGLKVLRRSMAVRASRSGSSLLLRSRRSHGMPLSASRPAIWEPIVPAPRTATLSII